jgi:RNA polymerase sigma-70 factor (ECF subfamily)
LAEDLRTLIQYCLSGDQAAMVRFVNRYQEMVFRLCYRMLGHRQDAEDAAQETFVRALRSLSNWDSSRKFEPWLLAIAGNRCRTMLAARCRRPVVGAIVDEQFVDETPDWQAVWGLAEEVQRALQFIRPEFREAFVLFHENELRYDEIADVMRRPLGTIKTWIRRARQELIAQLKQREVVEESGYALRRV